MKRVFIGHRGTGKTALLQRHSQIFNQIFPQIPHLDLDLEIENYVGEPLSDYFTRVGEVKFRQVEQEVFLRITAQPNFVISLGAGFDVSIIPNDIEVVLVRRLSDSDGRIFLDRPRLNTDVSLLEEYYQRYHQRENRYIEAADWVYHMPEGIEDAGPAAHAIEGSILRRDFNVENAYYTLTAQELPFIEQLLRNFSKIELRTDLLEAEQIESLLERYPWHEWLVSVRSGMELNWQRIHMLDTDIHYYREGSQIISCHEDHINYAIQQLEPFVGKGHLKLSSLVDSFDGLITGYRWQQEDPENRSFLPRSSIGRWPWFRQLSSYWQSLNFIKSRTEMSDQPSWFEWLSLPPEAPQKWAAVLGRPVHASRSPTQHHEFFHKRETFFTRVSLNEDELLQHHSFLSELKLGYAAVTSPLKEIALQISKNPSPVSQKLQAANTLMLKNDGWWAHNTDLEGFKSLTRQLSNHANVAIWGGGGTLQMMKEVLPQAISYSSQTGKVRDPNHYKNEQEPQHLGEATQFDVLIWAAPRLEKTLFPSEKLQFKEVLDLNYVDHSMGLEFAVNQKIRYTSGLEMFRVQALHQQKFWEQV
ncbi:shikimate kinase [Pseudobdellovibrio exovorus]|uniref:Shikimate synthase n=1 Tax=Pseudobdellovibrio exovorus JSS TaxID=1184267 RepID=M4V5Q9_9BACT|nr:shikimate kinase [Pseudobdellovibrio exovorus]AGH94697.1 shikimate synthase [Pseudobdellovibrio exovorus JSS]